MNRLSDEQVKEELEKIGDWMFTEDGEISRQYRFNNFVKAIEFVNKVAELAEELGHHPDIVINYNRVTLSVITHDAGGITELDIELAKRCNGLL